MTVEALAEHVAEPEPIRLHLVPQVPNLGERAVFGVTATDVQRVAIVSEVGPAEDADTLLELAQAARDCPQESAADVINAALDGSDETPNAGTPTRALWEAAHAARDRNLANRVQPTFATITQLLKDPEYLRLRKAYWGDKAERRPLDNYVLGRLALMIAFPPKTSLGADFDPED